MDGETPTDDEFIPGLASTDNLESASDGGVIFSGSQHFAVFGGTFTHITKNYHSSSSVPSDLRLIRLRDINLRREISLERHSGVVDHPRPHDRQGVRRVYSATIEGRRSSVTVAIYQGSEAEEEWRRDVAKYMAVCHPNIVQIFGTAKSKNIHATILHDELIPLTHFLNLHRDSHFATVCIYVHVATEFEAAVDYIHSTLQRSLFDSDCTFYIRGSTRRFCADLVPGGISRVVIGYTRSSEVSSQRGLQLLGTPNIKATVINSLTLEQYHEICYWNFPRFHSLSTSPAAIVKYSTVVSCSLGQQPMELTEIASVRQLDLDVGQAFKWFSMRPPDLDGCWINSMRYGDILGNGWTRFTSHDTVNNSMIHLQVQWDTSGWLSQANHIFSRLRVSSNFDDYVVLDGISFEVTIFGRTADPPQGFLFLAPPKEFQPRSSFKWPDRIAYWSLDPTGAEQLSTQDADNLGFPSLGLFTALLGRSWDATIYDGLREFHRVKGFNPDSPEVAQHLGYSLYQSSNATVSTGDGGDPYSEELQASESADQEKEADLPNLHGELPAVSGTLESLMYIRMALISFLVISWLYDRM